jgi:hypothetical protein
MSVRLSPTEQRVKYNAEALRMARVAREAARAASTRSRELRAQSAAISRRQSGRETTAPDR